MLAEHRRHGHAVAFPGAFIFNGDGLAIRALDDVLQSVHGLYRLPVGGEQQVALL